MPPHHSSARALFSSPSTVASTAQRPRVPRARGGFVSAILLGAFALCASACDAKHAAGREPVRIGLLLPFTSDVSAWANDVVAGIDLALADQPGLIEFVRRDDQGDPTRAAELVHELVTSNGVVAIVGSLKSSCCLAAAERAESLEVPVITPSGTHKSITQGRRWSFRMCFSDPQQGDHMARFAISKLGRERAAILKDITQDYSLGLADVFMETFIRKDGKITEEISYSGGNPDLEAIRQALSRSQCDAIYIPGYPRDVAAILNATASIWSAREVTFLGGDGWESPELKASVERWPKEVYITTHFTPEGREEAVQNLVGLFAQKHPGEKPSSFTALGYDTGLLLTQVIQKGARTREAIRRGIVEALPAFRGATGSFAFDAGRSEPVKNIPVLRWSGDGWMPARQ